MGTLATQSQLNQISPERAQRAEAMINWLFQELKGIFPGWRTAFETEADYLSAKQTWLRVLVQEKITKSQLQDGLNAAEKSKDKFLPSVGLFVSWCKALDYHALGLPNETELYQRYQTFLGYARFNLDEFQYRSKVEYWLLKNLYEKCKKKSEEDTLKAIPKLLTEAAEKVRSNFPFEEIPKGIPEQPSFYDKDRANQARDRLMAEVRGAMQ
ncbi:replication P [Rodentibacter caecimuris]|uniref:replication protein P n=1 Tax=Rodentibacter caecimuris TaxID=1796644 RepID=UPI0007512DEC|nr:replication protein P [Rodentibacter heylii]AOF53686.1 Replication protein P [Pasteurellaceae bacterium NI1060]OOF71220.1 replication P [Rodentibacter heylii]